MQQDKTEIHTPLDNALAYFCYDRGLFRLSNQRRKHENQEQFIYSTSASTEIKLSKRLKVQAHREISVCFSEGGAAMLCADLH